MRSALLAVLSWTAVAGAVPGWFPREFRAESSSDGRELSGYLRAAGLPGSGHVMGTVRSGSLGIACHAWLPPGARGTVFLVHGYYNHSGTWAPHVRRLLAEGWAVAALDLPGHGLSDGRRFDVDSIPAYAGALRALEDSLRGRAPLPWCLVGHSMGGAVAIERAREPAFPYRRVVLLAPMVRYAGWGWIGTVLPAVRAVRDYVPRGREVATSSDSGFLRRIHADPLEGWTTSTHWLGAVRAWNARLGDAPLADAEWTVIQGDADGTVDWRYGNAWLGSHLRRGRIRMVLGARHHLHNEGGEPGRIVRAVLDSALAGALPERAKLGYCR